MYIFAAGEPTLLFANRHDLRQLHIHSGRYRLVVNGMHSAIALDYDYHNNAVFWTDVTSENISRYFLDIMFSILKLLKLEALGTSVFIAVRTRKIRRAASSVIHAVTVLYEAKHQQAFIH